MKEKIHCRVPEMFIYVNSVINKTITKKVFLIMRLAAFILFLINMQVSANSAAQNISISKSGISLKDAFAEIREQSGYYFIYNDELVAPLKPASINIRNASVEEALKELLKNYPLEYRIEDKIIIIRQKKNITAG